MSSPAWRHCERKYLQNKKLRLENLDRNMASMRVDLLEEIVFICLLIHSSVTHLRKSIQQLAQSPSNNIQRINRKFHQRLDCLLSRHIGFYAIQWNARVTRKLDEEKINPKYVTSQAVWRHLLFEPIHEDLHNLLLGCGRSPHSLRGILLRKRRPRDIRFRRFMDKNQTGVGGVGAWETSWYWRFTRHSSGL